jgi:hypothetical protein
MEDISKMYTLSISEALSDGSDSIVRELTRDNIVITKNDKIEHDVSYTTTTKPQENFEDNEDINIDNNEEFSDAITDKQHTKTQKTNNSGLWNKVLRDSKKKKKQKEESESYSSILSESDKILHPKTILMANIHDDQSLKNQNIKLFDHIKKSDNSAISEKIKRTINHKLALPSSGIVNRTMNSSSNSHLSSLVNLWETITDEYKLNNQKHFEQPSIDIPVLSRAYLKDFFREPIESFGERPCVSADSCASITLAKNYKKQSGNKSFEPFVLRELLLPKDQKKMAEILILHPEESPIKLMEKYFPEKNFCILCKRFITSMTHLKNQVEKPSEYIQTHSNLFDIHGEYSKSAALTCGQNYSGLLRPIVRYDMSDYIPHKYDIFAVKFKSQPSVFKKVTKYSEEDEDRSGEVNNIPVKDVDETYYENLQDEMYREYGNDELILQKYDELKISGSDEIIQKYTMHGWAETPVIIYNQFNDSMCDDSSNLAERLVDSNTSG